MNVGGVVGKSMVRWFIFNILKIPHLTLVKILVVMIVIKLEIVQLSLMFSI